MSNSKKHDLQSYHRLTTRFKRLTAQGVITQSNFSEARLCVLEEQTHTNNANKQFVVHIVNTNEQRIVHDEMFRQELSVTGYCRRKDSL